MKSPNPKPEYSSEEVGTIYSYILSAYLDKSWNAFIPMRHLMKIYLDSVYLNYPVERHTNSN